MNDEEAPVEWFREDKVGGLVVCGVVWGFEGWYGGLRDGVVV